MNRFTQINNSLFYGLIMFLLFLPWTAEADSSAPVDFSLDIQPILSKKCFACHGPSDQESGLALDKQASATKEADSGSIAILPGDPDKSELILRITSHEEDHRMPPEGEMLSEKEVNLIKKWIEQGAPYATHWSFVKPVATTPPEVSANHQVQNEIDQFILKKLEDQKITPSPKADRATLLRRLSLDLTGLLPSIDELNSFLNDDSENACEKVVDRLLASPHYGERWGRHWLDLARYADTFGYERDDVRPNAWRYRDWVVNSFNTNQPYHEFVVEQLAGDLLPEPNLEQKIATGLHRMNIKNMEAGINKEDYRNREIIDRLNTTGTAFLGLTIGCCQCHSHKYDPVSQKEYYEMYAFFNNTVPENIDIPGTAEEQAKYQNALKAYNAKRNQLTTRQGTLKAMQGQESQLKWIQSVHQNNIDLNKVSQKLDQIIKEKQEDWSKQLTQKDATLIGFSKEILKILKTESYQRTVEQKEKLKKEFAKLPKYLENVKKKIKQPEDLLVSLDIESDTRAALLNQEEKLTEENQKRIDDFWKTIKTRLDETAKAIRQQSVENRHLPKPQVMTLVETGKDRRETFVLARGDFKQKVEKVSARTPKVLNELKSRQDQPDRLDLANWIASEDNPLTARVAVNHIWKHLFGEGIVSTMDDFGTQGSPPSHPKLLDWLAVRFMDSGWDRKAMIKLIVMSSAYQQSSVYRPELESVDPQNRLLARQSRFRVESEIIRDLFLNASDLIHLEMGGPTIHPQIPQAMRDQGYKYKTRWELSDKPERYRRGLYIHFKRTNPYPSLIMFDNPEGNVCTAERNRSNTPLQSLVTLNDPVFVECARELGTILHRKTKESDRKSINETLQYSGQKCLSRDFNQEELTALTELYQEELKWYQDHPEETARFLGSESNGSASPEQAAWTSVARTLLNLDEFITRE